MVYAPIISYSLRGGGGGGRGGWPVDLFYGYLQEGDLIDNLPSKEVEMREVCFSCLTLGGRGICKTRSHIVVVTNEEKTDQYT